MPDTRKLMRVNQVTALIIMPVLFAAWVILWLYPTRTEQLWAWTIASRMTPITMGSGYLGGVWFFSRMARSPAPRRVAGGLAAAAVFVVGLGVTTIIHWDKFNHDHLAFWAWSALYFFTPFFLPWLFLVNFRAATDGAADAGRDERPVPRWAVITLVSVGAIQLVAAVTWFVAPHLAIDNWPWPMTPLTTRTIASFVAFSGTLLLWVVVDRRWVAVQAGIEALTIGLTVTLIGAVIAHDDFTGSDVGVVLYVVALVSLLAAFALLMIRMAQRSAGTQLP
jgi:hypothetical protein